MGKIISDWQDLKKVLSELKSEGKKIVFTNGCFDIIHIGHIHYLKEAKKLGNILVIGLNSDTSIRTIKPNRPIISEQERAVILSALEMVDYVTLFNEETAYNLIKFLQPDVLVKGGDWEKKDIIGSDIVKEVYTLKYIKGVSTTEIINKILQHTVI